MFLDTSRYAGVGTAEVEHDGRTVLVVKLRRLPAVVGEPLLVTQADRLDLIAHTRYADATMFWHVADANSSVDATTLTAQPGSVLLAPRV
jgi:hypothetical protein